MNWNMFGTNWRLFGDLAAVAFIALLVSGTGLFIYIRQLRSRPPLPISEGIGARRAVFTKLRTRLPLSPDELEFANRAVTELRSPLAFAIPAAVFSLGCLYVLGSLEQLHGATPSERTFIGVIPMLGALNMTAQILRVRRLNKLLPAPSKVQAK